ncbi:AsmA protein [Mesorhizobium soli]|uniref:AsmA family protein n=1 Tax=Pseudaminobacter soli (ex Li et al. 2025) TaxID=1295366 RepID=UPI0024769B27|nr:AsmA family protein [Mesorhizobium soli]MDH6230310.1 AsmA protein [Mesorhizobium soli]
MPSPLVRRSIWLVGMAALAVALIIALVPFLASTRIVGDRIAYELSSWSGYRVTIGAAPEIRVWPSLRAIVTDVAMTPWDALDHPPVIEAERIEIKLSALAALRGDAVFSAAELVRPTLRLERMQDGRYLPESADGGRIANAIHDAREAIAANVEPAAVERSLSSRELGTISMRDGRVTEFADGKDEEILTGLTGKLNWPALNKAASVSLSAIWHGEEVNLEASLAKPLVLLAGGEAPVAAALTSAPATASFDGVVKAAENAYVDGKMKAAAPSLKRLTEWTGTEMASTASAIGSVSIGGRLVGDTQRMKLEGAEVALDKNPGTGALDLSFSERVPVVSGTLAFDTLDLSPILTAFTPATSEKAAAEIDPVFANLINLDLRLSAAHALVDTVMLADVAATAQIKNSIVAFDISDASAFGGNLQAGVRFDRKPEGTQAEMRFLASDIEGGAFGAAAGMTRLVPIGRGNISLILKGPGRVWESIIENGEGTISASFGPGALPDFDLAGFQKRCDDGGFFPLDEVSKGTLPIDGAELKATVAHGVIRLEKAEARSPQGRLWLTGIIPYVSRGLALSGGIVAPDAPATEDSQPPASFFVGGSWNAPFVSPVNSD